MPVPAFDRLPAGDAQHFPEGNVAKVLEEAHIAQLVEFLGVRD